MPPPTEDNPPGNGLNNNAAGNEPISTIAKSGPDDDNTKSRDRHSKSQPVSNAGRSGSIECSPGKMLPNTPEAPSPGIKEGMETGECSTHLPVQEEVSGIGFYM